MPEELGEPHVPDPGDEPLVEEGVAEQTRRARCDDPPRERVGVRARREQIRAEPEVGAGREPERRAVPEPRLELGAAQDEPGPAERRRPTGATRQRPFIPRWLWTTTPPSK